MDKPTNKRSATVTAVVMVAGSLAWVAGISMSGLEGSRGFFGRGPLIADANLVLEIFLLAGLWIVLQMNDVLPRGLHVPWWKNLMRATLAGYWATALLGFATYYFWYVA